jgi:hypothetical protein
MQNTRGSELPESRKQLPTRWRFLVIVLRSLFLYNCVEERLPQMMSRGDFDDAVAFNAAVINELTQGGAVSFSLMRTEESQTYNRNCADIFQLNNGSFYAREP